MLLGLGGVESGSGVWLGGGAGWVRFLAGGGREGWDGGRRDCFGLYLHREARWRC